MRRFAILLAVAVAVGVLPSLASSAAPVKEMTVSGTLNISADSCGFPVTVIPSKDVLRIFTFGDGRQILTGSYLATATGNGKSLELNLSGQGVFDPQTETFTSTGATLLILDGSLQLVHGPIIFGPGPADIRIVSHNVVDVCAALASP